MLKVSFMQNLHIYVVLCYDVEVLPNSNGSLLILTIGKDEFYQPIIYTSNSDEKLKYERRVENVYIQADAGHVRINLQAPQITLSKDFFFAKGGTETQWQEVVESGLVEEVLSCILKGYTPLQAMREWDI